MKIVLACPSFDILLDLALRLEVMGGRVEGKGVEVKGKIESRGSVDGSEGKIG